MSPGRSVPNPATVSIPPVQESQFPYGLTIPETRLSAGLVAQGYSQAHLGGIMTNDGSAVNTIPQLSTMPPPPVPSQVLHKTTSSLDLERTDISSQNANPSSTPQFTQPSHTSSQTFTATNSSQVSVSVVDSTNRPSDADTEKTMAQTNQKVSSHTIFSALQETTSIYNLPPDVLEHALGDVIREDGFVSLVSVNISPRNYMDPHIT